MTFEEMQEFLNKIQIERPQTKIMNALLGCYQQVKNHEKMIIELQEKTNEIVAKWNEEFGDENIEDAEIKEIDAAALNDEIPEDIPQEDVIAEGEITPEEIQGAFVDEPPREE